MDVKVEVVIYNKSGAAAVCTMASLAKGAPRKRVTGGSGVRGNMSTGDLLEACRNNEHLKHYLLPAELLDGKRKRIAHDRNNINFLLNTLGPGDENRQEELNAKKKGYNQQLAQVEKDRKVLQSQVLLHDKEFRTRVNAQLLVVNVQAQAQAKARAEAQAKARAEAEAREAAETQARIEAGFAVEQEAIQRQQRELQWEIDFQELQQIETENVVKDVCGGDVSLF